MRLSPVFIKSFIRPASLACLLACAPTSLSHGANPAEFRPQYTPAQPGLDYAHLQITNQPWSIHVARLERSQKNFDIVTTLGKGTIEGLSPLTTQIKSVPHEAGQPVAAVNGDFFVIKPGPYQGDPEGLQILNGDLVSAPGKLSFWVDRGQFHIEPVKSEINLTWPRGRKISLGLNENPKADRATLFTPAFGQSTRATNFTEVVLEKLDGGSWLPFHASQLYRVRVRSLNNSGNTAVSDLRQSRRLVDCEPLKAD